jgi:putative ubiquitin-RnfH superfamily antitoxin RatB of RatAB toxin-antitoxin module
MDQAVGMPDKISVEVVFALPNEQALVKVAPDEGATVADAIALSGFAERFSGEKLDAMQTGIWGRPVDRCYQVNDGDRVEIYRPLQRDPRDARRELANSGLTMSETIHD